MLIIGERINTCRPSVAAIVAAGLAGVSGALAAEPAAAAGVASDRVPAVAAAESNLVLDGFALWRCIQLQGDHYLHDGTGALARASFYFHNGNGCAGGPRDVPPPVAPTNWTVLAFDDGAWPLVHWPQPAYDGIVNLYGMLNSATFNPYESTRLLARGRFNIPDPARIKECNLSLSYWGGVVVYVNGTEVTRRHMSGVTTNGVPIAESYPQEAFCDERGKVIKIDATDSKHLALRERRLQDMKIPASLLRKGVNVIAVEANGSPIHPKGLTGPNYGWPGHYWVPVALLDAQLAVTPAGSATAAATRAGEVGIRNCGMTEHVTIYDAWNPAEPMRPVAIRAARNSVFSGRLVVGSDQAIKSLKATVTDLAQVQGPAKIPASAVRVRCAVQATPGKSYVSPLYFDGLLDEIPTVIPVPESRPAFRPFHGGWKTSWSGAVARAVAPLWFTVRVPRNVPGGLYEGSIRVEAEGLAPTAVALRVHVSHYTTPDPKDFWMQNALYHSEDAMVFHYEIPRWSDKHFEYLGKSLALAAELNSRQVFANLVYNFAGSNGESLIRWIKQADGTYKLDFTIFDKYLNMAAKAVGKPRPLRLNCWGAFGSQYEKAGQLDTWGASGPGAGGACVTGVDPATGNLIEITLPLPGTAESLAFWQPVFAELLPRLDARGWLDETMLGYTSRAAGPPPTLVDMAYKLWSAGVWSHVSHTALLGTFQGTQTNVVMPVRHACSLNNQSGTRPSFFCSPLRTMIDETSALTELRRVGEETLRAGWDGVGEFGLDLFPTKRESRMAPGKFWYECPGGGRGMDWTSTQGGPGAHRATMSLIYPGPNGPLATERYEMLREGIELSEAIRFIRKAIGEKKLDVELDERAKLYLDERAKAFVGSAFSLRHMCAVEDAKLLDLAGEVARALEGKK